MQFISNLCSKIPLVLGPLRDVDATTLAVDAVFNPGVIEGCVKCEDDSNNKGGWKDSVNGGRAMGVFKQQIIDLASDWVARDLGVSFSKSWSPMKDNYSGYMPLVLSSSSCWIRDSYAILFYSFLVMISR